MQATTRRALHSSFIVFVLVLVVAVVAAPTFASSTATPPAIYGARAMGMGGAYTAVADDATAMYWNPSAIGSKLISANVSVGLSGIANLEALKALMEPEELAKLEGRPDVRAAVLAGVNIGPIGLVGIIDGDASVGPGENSSVEGEANVQSSNGIGAARDVITWGNGLFGVRAGLVARAIQAERTTVKIDPLVGRTEELQKGKGYAIDLGIQVRVTDMFTAGGSVRNAIGELTWDGVKESPTTEYRVGVAVQPPLLGLTIAADVAVPDELRYGVEKTLFFGGLRLRAGQIRNDGGTWTTAGAGLALGPVTVDAAIITPDFKDNSYSMEAAFRF